MGKRIMIFTEERKDQERIKSVCFGYLEKILPKNYNEITFQIFSNIAESSHDDSDKIGAGRELFIIFDRKLNPRDPYTRLSTSDGFKSASYEMSVNLCNELMIPNIIYEGELVKEGSSGLDRKFNGIRDSVVEKFNRQ
jgi:hypothetical protein